MRPVTHTDSLINKHVLLTVISWHRVAFGVGILWSLPGCLLNHHRRRNILLIAGGGHLRMWHNQSRGGAPSASGRTRRQTGIRSTTLPSCVQIIRWLDRRPLDGVTHPTWRTFHRTPLQRLCAPGQPHYSSMTTSVCCSGIAGILPKLWVHVRCKRRAATFVLAFTAWWRPLSRHVWLPLLCRVYTHRHGVSDVSRPLPSRV